MRILLDDGVPRTFERDLSAHEATHWGRLGWEGLTNGKLLAAALEAGFPVMVTVDRNLQFQQNLTGRKIAVLVLRVPNNGIATLREMAEGTAEILPPLEPRTVAPLNSPSMR